MLIVSYLRSSPFSLARQITQLTRLGESHALLDLGNRQRRVEALGACPRAVKNGVASVQAHAVVEGVLALGLLLVTRVGDPAVRLEKNSGSEVLLLVPPVGRAGCRAAGAENAFVETVELLAVLLGLAVFTALEDVSVQFLMIMYYQYLRQAKGWCAEGRA